MSKRAEEKALEIFPVKKVPYYGLSCNAYSERDANLDNRTLFCMGYEQAEKDVWDRIEKYLSEREPTDYATVGWILKNIEEYKKKIMEVNNE